VLAVATCAAYFGPFGPTGPAGPDDHPNGTKTRLLLFVALRSAFFPASVDETPGSAIGPVIVIGALLLLPFLSGEGEKSWRRRPIAVLTILLVAVTLATSPISQDIPHGART